MYREYKNVYPVYADWVNYPFQNNTCTTIDIFQESGVVLITFFYFKEVFSFSLHVVLKGCVQKRPILLDYCSSPTMA
jgi:hypothetical protein